MFPNNVSILVSNATNHDIAYLLYPDTAVFTDHMPKSSATITL